MNEKILNYTPHTVNLITEEGAIVDFASVGVARCSQKTTPVTTLETEGYKIPITTTTFGEVEGLPTESKEGVFYIVSRLVMSACTHRKDLLVPNDMVRDEEGKIIGCKSLANN